ncbi:hypothetical protein ACHABX_02655 [Nesterenkonia halotolerans]|uniref:hypothetical protein n=1 Tax=Nesterenkonia halotolerans TaxID=225325 RepID=UPI003EE70B56
MARQKIFGFIELADGTEHEDFRVGLPSKLQAERTARARNWDPETQHNQVAAFTAWHAACKVHKLIDMTFDEFMDTAVDAGVYHEDPEDKNPESDYAEDPTRADQSDDS